MTAAHCVYGKPPRSLEVKLGDNDVTTRESGEKRVAACKIVNHPYYSRTRYATQYTLLVSQATFQAVFCSIEL